MANTIEQFKRNTITVTINDSFYLDKLSSCSPGYTTQFCSPGYTTQFCSKRATLYNFETISISAPSKISAPSNDQNNSFAQGTRNGHLKKHKYI